MSKVKAFTILEMLINLTIMSIIMGLIYFAYSSFVQQVINYQSSIEQQNKLSRTYVQLKADFYNADRIVRNNKDFAILKYNTKEIRYKVTGTYLIRNQAGMLDTLQIDDIHMESNLNLITKEELITKMVVKTMLFEEPIEFMVIKEYAPNLTIKL